MNIDKISDFKHIFFRWLKDNGYYSVYRKELFNNAITFDEVIFKKMFFYIKYEACSTRQKDLLLCRIISYSFTWANTRQGVTYWNNICKEFTDFYIQLKNIHL